MARRQRVPRVFGSFLDRKARQAEANIAGRGRRGIFTYSDIDENTTLKGIRTKFFQSLGDALFINISGGWTQASGSGILRFRILDEDGVLISNILQFTPGATATPKAVIFSGSAYIRLGDNRQVGASGLSHTYDGAMEGFTIRVPSTTGINLPPILNFDITTTGTFQDLEIDFLSAEYVPAVIK